MTDFTPDPLTETISFSDNKLSNIGRELSNSLELSDGKIFSIIKNLPEIINLSDSKLFSITKNVISTINLSDNRKVSIDRTVVETINLSDNRVMEIARGIIDTLIISTGEEIFTARTFSESIKLSGTYSRVWDSVKTCSDSIELSDIKRFSIIKLLTDTLTTSAGEASAKVKNLFETLVIKRDYIRPLWNRTLSTNTKFAIYAGSYQKVINALDIDGIPEQKVKGFSFADTGNCAVLVHKH